MLIKTNQCTIIVVLLSKFTSMKTIKCSIFFSSLAEIGKTRAYKNDKMENINTFLKKGQEN